MCVCVVSVFVVCVVVLFVVLLLFVDKNCIWARERFGVL